MGNAPIFARGLDVDEFSQGDGLASSHAITGPRRNSTHRRLGSRPGIPSWGCCRPFRNGVPHIVGNACNMPVPCLYFSTML